MLKRIMLHIRRSAFHVTSPQLLLLLYDRIENQSASSKLFKLGGGL